MQYATEENLTDLALKRWEACHSPRLREIMQSLVKHVHEFVREVDLKEDEWLTGMNWLAKTGQLSSDKRHEFILLPLTKTVQAPHWPLSQPFLVPVNEISSRNRSNKVVLVSTSIFFLIPLMEITQLQYVIVII